MKHTLLVLLLLLPTVAGEVTCTRDYGGRLVLGECWYLDNGEYKELKDVAGFQWVGGVDGGFLLNASGISEPFTVTLKPYVVSVSGNVYSVGDIKAMHPNVKLKNYIHKTRDYKWGINLTDIPQASADNIRYIAFVLEDSNGITWGDVELQPQRQRLILKDVTVSYQDIIESGMTVTLYNKTTVLIGNITGETDLYLDPTVTLNAADTENLDDTWVYEGASSTNYGSDADLEFHRNYGSTDRHAAIRWNLSVLSGASAINEALLESTMNGETYEAGEYANITVQILFNNHTWDESTMTYANQPSGGVIGGVCGYMYWEDGDAVGTKKNITVTDCISRGVITEGYENVSLWFATQYSMSNHNNDPLSLGSKEDGTEADRPKLYIDYDTGVDPTNLTIDFSAPANAIM